MRIHRTARSFSFLAGFLAAGISATTAQEAPQAPPPQTPPPSQQPAPTPSPGPGRTPTTPTQPPFPGRDQQRLPGEEQRPQFPDMQRPIFLSGKVVLEDGTAPPDNVVVERVCNGVARPEGYTDSKGRFSFQLGNNPAVFHDASVGSAADDGFGRMGNMGSRGGMGGQNRGISERDLMGCELRASLAGYRSEVVNLANRRVFDNPDVGTIVLRRLGNVEGLTVSFVSLKAPKDAKKAFDKGKNHLKKKKNEEARKEFEKAVQLYPEYATAWFELGLLAEQRNEAEPARKAYEQALASDPKFMNPYLQLALIAAKENKWQEVADTTDRVVRMNPMDFPQAYFYNSVANYNLRKIDAAEKSAREAVKLDTAHRMPKAEHLLGVILAEKRDYTGAAAQMRNYLKFAPDASDAETVRKQLSEMERLGGVAAQTTAPATQP